VELALSIASAVLSLAALLVAILKRRKPSLQAAVIRAVGYAEQVSKKPEDRLAHAIAAVIREDLGDNGKRDWPDARIRFEVEALLNASKQ
jgi:hypothetical protein